MPRERLHENGAVMYVSVAAIEEGDVKKKGPSTMCLTEHISPFLFSHTTRFFLLSLLTTFLFFAHHHSYYFHRPPTFTP